MAVRNVVMGLVMLGLGILPVVAGSNASAASALRGSAAQIDQNNTGDTALEVKSADATFAMGIENKSNANTSSFAGSQPQLLNNTALKSAAGFVAYVYEHENFLGDRFAIFDGRYNFGDSWNDKITSLIVYPHGCVEAFENSNFNRVLTLYCAGKEHKFVRNVGSNWNDKISSIKAWSR
mmetsp:Transcript_54010/g.120841  ORF Transcript_54010/g.120841 Transcript_54010/m.120841 type:complete len:179 (-) Transcript_54010:210-746(-)